MGNIIDKFVTFRPCFLIDTRSVYTAVLPAIGLPQLVFLLWLEESMVYGGK